jgi:hypothetical protein
MLSLGRVTQWSLQLKRSSQSLQQAIMTCSSSSSVSGIRKVCVVPRCSIVCCCVPGAERAVFPCCRLPADFESSDSVYARDTLLVWVRAWHSSPALLLDAF